MKSHKLAKTFRLGLKQTGLDKKIRKASTAQLLSMFVRRCSRQCSHTVVIFFSNPKAPPDPPGSTGSTRIHLVDPRIHLPNLTYTDVSAFWATFIYIILILQRPPGRPSNSFRILWGAGGGLHQSPRWLLLLNPLITLKIIIVEPGGPRRVALALDLCTIYQLLQRILVPKPEVAIWVVCCRALFFVILV